MSPDRYSYSVSWNPSVGVNCTALFVDYYVCIDMVATTSSGYVTATTTNVSYIYPYSTWVPTAPSVLPTAPKPSPVQSGFPSSCYYAYEAMQGDNCTALASGFGFFTPAQFEKLNPAVGSDCSGLQPGYYYCLALSAPPMTLPTVTALPSPVPSGIVASCRAWYQALSGDTCALITQGFGTFNISSFISWNPSLGLSCNGLITGDYYCVNVPGILTTQSPPSVVSGNPNNNGGPAPQQPGVVASCNAYWYVGR